MFESYKTKKGNKLRSICKKCESHKDGHYSQYDILTQEELKQLYLKVRNGEIKALPRILTHNYTEENLIMLVRYLCVDLLECDTREKLLEILDSRIFAKNGLHKAINHFKDIMTLIKKCFPEHNIEPWDLKNGNIHGMYDSIKQRKKAIERFLDDLIKEETIEKPIDIVHRKDIYKLIQASVVGAALKKFNNSSIYMLMWYFNNFTENRIYEWDFVQPPRGFWSKEKNCIRAFKTTLREYKFYEMPLEEQKEFIRGLDQEFFSMNGIKGAVSEGRTIHNLIQKSLGENFIYEWEYYKGYGLWEDKKKRIKHMKELIEKVLKLDKQDIPKYIKQSSLKGSRYNKFAMPCTLYYNGNYFEWINECYPGEFTKEDFSVISGKDGTLFLSNEERLVYEYIQENITDKIRYIGRCKNEKYNYKDGKKKYQPDFVIEDWLDKPVLIEHFGLYSEHKEGYILKEYREKAHSKMDFFSKRSDIYFVSTFPRDIRFNFKGLEEKLKNLKYLRRN